MITLVWRTDVHLATQSPQSRTDDWADTVLKKLDQVGEIADEVSADAVIDGGDFFHIKTPSRTTHELIQRVAAVHARYPCPVYAVRNGNHDVKHSDGKYLHEAPLGVLFETGVFRMLDEQGVLLRDQDDDLSVRLVGVPYHGTKYDMNRLTTIVKGDEDYLLVAAHLLASQGGGEMFGGEDIVRYSDIINLDPDVYCFGHWHKNQGVYRHGGKHIVNIGSLTRGSLSQDDVNRIPEVAIIRFEDYQVTVEQRPLKVQPAAEVFDMVGRVRQEARTMTVGGFVDSVKGALEAGQDKPLLDEVREMDLPDPVRERLLLYLEASGAS